MVGGATEEQGTSLEEVLSQIELKRTEAKQDGMSQASIDALYEIANQLISRTVRISGVLTNHELERTLEVPPVQGLTIKIGGIAVRTEEPEDWPLIGRDFPVIEFGGNTLSGVEQPEGRVGIPGCTVVGELHKDGVTSLEAF